MPSRQRNPEQQDHKKKRIQKRENLSVLLLFPVRYIFGVSMGRFTGDAG